MIETWKDVVGYEGLYEVSDFGNVRSKPRVIHVIRGKDEYDLVKEGKNLKPQPLHHGYVGVWLYGGDALKGRNGKQYSVHRLVAKAFCQNPNDYSEVNHINEDKADNRACNLEWCSHIQNSRHGTRPQRIGLAHRNDPNKRRRKIAQYTKDGELVEIFPSITELRRRGYNAGNAWYCANGHRAYSTSQGYVWKFVD